MYVSGVTAGQAADVIAGVRDVPVLTLSDVEGFTERGGIAQFFFDNGQLRFTVQLESVKRARLRISSSQHRQDSIPQNGRTARIGLRWSLWTK